MVGGIAVQTGAITVAVLAAFLLGQSWYAGDLVRAQATASVTLPVSELLWAYTARSERYGPHQIGVLSNRHK